jgi:AraC family transcriptional regulator, ethanolamine operon transcriptional activator
VRELSRRCDVAERTPGYGFREAYSTTPLTFVKTQRLTRSRLALLRAGVRTSIRQIARAHGFTHMGQYSHDYHRLFGETPSMTHARRRPVPVENAVGSDFGDT